MNAKSLKILAAVLAGLVVAFLLLDQARNSREKVALLLPDLKSQINAITSVVVQKGDDTVTIAKTNDSWSVRERENYPADIGLLRSSLLALSAARVVEQKTSNPEKYHLIGVNDPADPTSESIKVTVSSEDFDYAVIFGKVAQSRFRYARISGETQGVLIDQNPDFPDLAAGWLVESLVDIGSERIRHVTIAHSDGETIKIEKNPDETASFNVVNIPPGRELSYPGVANGIGGALSDLSLEDVRRAPAEPAVPDVTTTFSTRNGLILEATVVQDEGDSWIEFSAKAVEPVDDAVESDATDEADEINRRLGGWQYTLPDYKISLLKKRLDDLLKEQEKE